ncbi:RDD family protein [Streptomyces sp. NPDC001922]|uniref:RDD family protein n=1 Tax=Streptomyces sp. NPDC001922 TaxID=3364624 RepID=UPI003689E633
MSAPTSGSADGSPSPGYYPDPSIPSYIRYWNGSSWVPGTSRPAPKEGEETPGAPAAAAPAPAAFPGDLSTSMEESGPVFLDEDPALAASSAGSLPESGSGGPDGTSPPAGQGSRSEPASAWQADASRQTGFSAEQERRISWGAESADTPGAHGAAPSVGDGPGAAAGGAGAGGVGAGGAAQAVGRPVSGAFGPPQDPERPADAQAGSAGRNEPSDRSPEADGGAAAGTTDRQGPSATVQLGARTGSGPAGRDRHDGTMTLRADAGERGASSGADRKDGTLTIRAARPGAARERIDAIPPQPGPEAPSPTGQAAAAQPDRAPSAQVPPQQTPAATPAAPTPHQPSVPAQQQAPGPGPAAPQSPVTQGPGGGQPSWAQQVHRLATPDQAAAGAAQGQGGAGHGGAGQGGAEGVIPWRPPVDDPFLRAAQAQASVRPAALGRRFAARLIDTVLLGGAVAAAAVPLISLALGHIDDKLEKARLTGETVTVWLVDGTTAGYFGAVLGVLLVAGVLYEALPVAKWGRTVGKRLCGVQVLDIETHDTPSFGAALRRWLLYGLFGVLAVGIVNVLWCLFDRPWRQCWHDKAARTFVAGTGGQD